jgi:hypothetical protein
VELADFAGDVTGDVVDEGGELLGRVWCHQGVPVRREHRYGMQPHAVLALSTADDADDQVIDGGGRAQQEAAVNGAHGDLDHCAGRKKP